MTQDTLIENEEKPGSIPQRKMTVPELVEVKLMARDAKERLGWLVSAIKSYNLDDKFQKHIEPIDSVGVFIDALYAYCQTELKKAELPKRKKGGKI